MVLKCMKMQRVRRAQNSWREKDVPYKTHLTTVVKTEGLGKDRQVDQWIGAWAGTHLPGHGQLIHNRDSRQSNWRAGGGISALNVKGGIRHPEDNVEDYLHDFGGMQVGNVQLQNIHPETRRHRNEDLSITRVLNMMQSWEAHSCERGSSPSNTQVSTHSCVCQQKAAEAPKLSSEHALIWLRGVSMQWPGTHNLF